MYTKLSSTRSLFTQASFTQTFLKPDSRRLADPGSCKSWLIQSILLLSLCVMTASPALAKDTVEHYVIDTKGMHAAIQFKIKHLGYSWLLGRFDKFSGSFNYDTANPANSNIEMTVQTASINSNHAERDKHLRGYNFLEVVNYPEAKFTSKSFTPQKNGDFQLKGNLTLHGKTNPVIMNVRQVGAGNDPWGDFRRGFEGKMMITLADFGIDYGLGFESRNLELSVYLEGIRQK